jgi:hypothetical protein
VALLGVLHQGGLLPTLVRPALWSRSMAATVAVPPTSCPPTPNNAAPAPESWLLLSYKAYTLPTAFVHAHLRELHSAAPACVPLPLLSVINVGDEQSVAARVSEAAREQQSRYSSARPSAPPLRLHRVLLLWPGSVAAPIQSLREAHASLLPALQRNLTGEQELAAWRTADSAAPRGSSDLTLQVLCPAASSHARGCVELRTRAAAAEGGGHLSPSAYFSSFPHLSLDDAPTGRPPHATDSDSFALRDQLALHARLFDMHLLPSE